MLKGTIKKIENDGGSDARVVFLGDYIDRGLQSRGVIEFLMNGLAENKNWVCLKGNHDQMFSLFMEDCQAQLTADYHWLDDRLGGKETLASYGVTVGNNDHKQDVYMSSLAAVPAEHIEFLDSLPHSHQENDLLFVHAGIRPGVPIEKQDPHELLWIRYEFLEDKRQHPFLVVHGHTPVERAQHYGNRVNLDTGSGYGRHLTAAVFEETRCWILTDKGKEALSPPA